MSICEPQGWPVDSFRRLVKNNLGKERMGVSFWFLMYMISSLDERTEFPSESHIGFRGYCRSSGVCTGLLFDHLYSCALWRWYFHQNLGRLLRNKWANKCTEWEAIKGVDKTTRLGKSTMLSNHILNRDTCTVGPSQQDFGIACDTHVFPSPLHSP